MEQDLIIATQQRVDEGVPARSVPFDWHGKRYWIKISLKSQKNTWHRLQNCFAILFRVPLLRATVSSSGDEGLSAECRRLERIAKRGVLVPKVVAQKPGWILLSDIGPCLYDQLNETDNKRDMLLLAARSMSKLHQANGWHGTGQLRDMIFADGQIGYIDFEENVGEAMETSAAQARDVLRFLISAVRYDTGDGQLLESLLHAYKEDAPKNVWPQIKTALKLMRPFACLLKPFQKNLGRDLRHALLVFNALKKTVRQP